MGTSRLTVVPILVAMMLAIVSMPTDIYQICRQCVGTAKTEPWRQTSLAALSTRLGGLWLQVTRWCQSDGKSNLPALAGATVALVLVATGHLDAHALTGTAMVFGHLKLYRQRDSDLKSEIATARTAKAAIGNAAVTEKRALTDDERAKFTEATTKITALEAQLADNTLLLQAAEEANEAERHAPVPEPTADAAASARAHIRVTDQSAADPKRGFKDHKDFLKAVMNAGKNGRMDPRLQTLRAAAGSDEQGEYSGPYGGFLVPSGVAPGILSVAPSDDVLTPLFTDVPMTTPTLALNARVDKNHATSVSGGFLVTRRPETVTGTASRQKYEQITLTANEEFGLAFATLRMMTDSPASFVAIIQAGFRDEFVANAMKEYISGTGVGERQGALNAGCKISVAKETGQAAATIVKANIDNMAARCWRYSRAVWLANQNTRAQLKSLVQVVGTGGNSVPYFATEGAPAGFDGLLDGRPLVFTEFAETLGTEGDLILIVPSEYLIATYQSEQYAESMHVRFMEAENAFRFYRRNDGQWWWSTALTPKKGSTLSPVVTLATR